MNNDENNEKFTTSDKKIQELTEISQKYSKIISNIMLETQKNIIGQEDIIKKILISIISDGHVLLESVPGLAKTLMIKTMADIFSVNNVRIQFTPDLLPADILGTKIYKNNSNTFEIQKGPIFHNFVLADEINRAPPKVQSALLESMQEKQVSIHGETFQLEKPFLVLATQNPIENEGTYKLPEAQVDRFALKILIKYPTKEEEIKIIEKNTTDKITKIEPILKSNEILQMQEFNSKIYADNIILKYVASIIDSTRNPDNYELDLKNIIEFGASPRASIWLIKAAKANAMINGRGYVIPEDVKEVAHDVLRHRLILTFEAEADEINSDKVIDIILDKIPSP
ncbi:MoxR family ATPase [Nitrosopumilus sp.]|nr:MoxR family ATPase [Nitrosopumilus sp.]MDB4840326.1 MoxR family ATPase [Nitrosopumilus sp.]